MTTGRLTFEGYRRPDGRVGVRNHLLVVPTVICSSVVADRVAAAVAPIGAVIGEWVGSSAGLGYLMLQANARMQVDLMFAALLVLAVMALLLWFAADHAGRALARWQPESLGSARGGLA